MDMDYYGHAHCSGLLGYSLGRGFADARGENQWGLKVTVLIAYSIAIKHDVWL